MRPWPRGCRWWDGGPGNLPYLANHGQEGLLVEPGDVAGLASALRALAEDAELRTRLGAAARRRAVTLPTWQQTAERFFAAVREAAASGEDSRHDRTSSASDNGDLVSR